MARPQRIEFAGALYHVSAKGQGGRLFHDAEDAERFLAILAQVCRRYDWAVLAYCLLPDRFELVAETRRPSLSEGMRRLAGLYGQAFNRRYGRRGPVFRGRFKAVLVDGEPYLAEVLESRRRILGDEVGLQPAAPVSASPPASRAQVQSIPLLTERESALG